MHVYFICCEIQGIKEGTREIPAGSRDRVERR